MKFDIVLFLLPPNMPIYLNSLHHHSQVHKYLYHSIRMYVLCYLKVHLCDLQTTNWYTKNAEHFMFMHWLPWQNCKEVIISKPIPRTHVRGDDDTTLLAAIQKAKSALTEKDNLQIAMIKKMKTQVMKIKKI